jgi:membrane protein required for beta-lactamase induction
MENAWIREQYGVFRRYLALIPFFLFLNFGPISMLGYCRPQNAEAFNWARKESLQEKTIITKNCYQTSHILRNTAK